jgi:hypothetical protein
MERGKKKSCIYDWGERATNHYSLAEWQKETRNLMTILWHPSNQLKMTQTFKTPSWALLSMQCHAFIKF